MMPSKPKSNKSGKPGKSDRPEMPDKQSSLKKLLKKVSSPNLKNKAEPSIPPEPIPSRPTEINWDDYSHQTQWKGLPAEERQRLADRMKMSPMQSRSSTPAQRTSYTSWEGLPGFPRTPDRAMSTTPGGSGSESSRLGPTVDTHSLRELAKRIANSPKSQSTDSPPSRPDTPSRSQTNLLAQTAGPTPIDEEASTEWPVPRQRRAAYSPVAPEEKPNATGRLAPGTKNRRLPDYRNRTGLENRVRPEFNVDRGPRAPPLARNSEGPAQAPRRPMSSPDLGAQEEALAGFQSALSQSASFQLKSRASPPPPRPPMLPPTTMHPGDLSPYEIPQGGDRVEARYAKNMANLKDDSFVSLIVGRKGEDTPYMLTRNQIRSALQKEPPGDDDTLWVYKLNKDLAGDFVHWLVFGDILPGGKLRYLVKLCGLYKYAVSEPVLRLQNHIVRTFHWTWTKLGRVDFDDAKTVFLHVPIGSRLYQMTTEFIFHFFKVDSGTEYNMVQLAELTRSTGIKFLDKGREIVRTGWLDKQELPDPTDQWRYMIDELN